MTWRTKPSIKLPSFNYFPVRSFSESHLRPWWGGWALGWHHESSVRSRWILPSFPPHSLPRASLMKLGRARQLLWPLLKWTPTILTLYSLEKRSGSWSYFPLWNTGVTNSNHFTCLLKNLKILTCWKENKNPPADDFSGLCLNGVREINVHFCPFFPCPFKIWQKQKVLLHYKFNSAWHSVPATKKIEYLELKQ